MPKPLESRPILDAGLRQGTGDWPEGEKRKEKNPKEYDESNLAWLEQYRESRALELGLPDDASWEKIYFVEDEQERALIAAELGISITEHAYEAKRLGLTNSEYPSWRSLLTKVLDLAPNVPAERIAARIREIKQEGQEAA